MREGEEERGMPVRGVHAWKMGLSLRGEVTATRREVMGHPSEPGGWCKLSFPGP